MQVAVAGLGKMGSALARRLLAQGLELTVWNRSAGAAEALAAEGALVAPDLAALWSQATVVITFLADDAATEQVVLGPAGLIAAAPPGGLIVDMSTISPAASSRVAAAAEARGIGYVRSPVSGNPGVLAAGQLTLIVSGPPKDVEAALPLLELVGPKVFLVGSGEEARVVKLAVNAVLGATAQAMAESVALSEACGVERSVFLDVLGSSAAGSPFVRYKRDALVARRYDATFTTAMLVKDLELALGVAAGACLQLPATSLLAELGRAACAEGLADLDFMALLPHLQALAGRPTDVPLEGAP